jgi:hypothetical protein
MKSNKVYWWKGNLITSLRTIFCITFWLHLDIVYLHSAIKICRMARTYTFDILTYVTMWLLSLDMIKSILWRQRCSVPLDSKIASHNSPCRQSTTRPVKDVSSGWNFGSSQCQTRICISRFLCVIILCCDKKCLTLCECLLYFCLLYNSNHALH